MPRHIDVRFPTDEKLANAVVQSRRLLDLLPKEDLDPLVAAYTAAKRYADEAARRRPAVDDVTSEVRSALSRGEEINVDDVFTRLTRNAMEKAAHAEAQDFFQGLPNQAKNALVTFFHEQRDDLYDGLARQLDDIMERAEAPVRELDGAYDAESALDAGKTAEFNAFRELAGDYADLRAAHLSLLRAEDDLSFAVDSPTLAWAFFTDVLAAYPAFLAAARSGTHSDGWRIHPDEPFPITTPDREHFLAAILHRATLGPRVARADQAVADRAAAVRDERPHTSEPLPSGPLSGYYGGENGVRARFGMR